MGGLNPRPSVCKTDALELTDHCANGPDKSMLGRAVRYKKDVIRIGHCLASFSALKCLISMECIHRTLLRRTNVKSNLRTDSSRFGQSSCDFKFRSACPAQKSKYGR